MRATLVTLAIVLLVSARAGADPINAVIGDASWISRYGHPPDESAPEDARLATHLSFVLARLRVHQGGPARAAALDDLERYIARGVFPRRGHDGHAGRRPRFIDDAGTHCAVGFLIAQTDPDLARRIDAEHEYAFVPDITTPGLRAWAERTGLTIDELATIQPSYREPPTFETSRQSLDDDKDRATARCAQEHEVPRTVTLTMTGDRDGHHQLATTSDDGFAACVANELERALPRGRGAYRSSPESFSRNVMLSLRRAPQILASVVDAWFAEQRHGLGVGVHAECPAGHGAVPSSVEIDVATDEVAMAAKVVTRPSNPAIDACMTASLRQALYDHGIAAGAWKPTLRQTRKLEPLGNSREADMTTSLELWLAIGAGVLAILYGVLSAWWIKSSRSRGRRSCRSRSRWAASRLTWSDRSARGNPSLRCRH